MFTLRLLGAQLELFHRRVDDPLVDLVRDDQLDLVPGQLGDAHRVVDQLGELGDGELVNLAPP